MNVAPTTLATFDQQRHLTMLSQVGNDRAIIVVNHECANGHTEINVICALAVAISATAILAMLCTVQFCETIVDQRIDITISDSENTSAFTAITAIGPAKRTEFFSAKRCNTVATVTGHNFDFCFVNELHDLPP
jgi:hypothetical protein